MLVGELRHKFVLVLVLSELYSRVRLERLFAERVVQELDISAFSPLLLDGSPLR
jgi:hypothetical protein